MNRFASVLPAVLFVVSCQGRDPDVGKLPVVEPEPPARVLQRRALFGAMPIENRFQDPLITFSGTGWFAFGAGRAYPTTYRRVDDTSPTKSPVLVLPGPENTGGVTALGQLKTARTPLHIEAWLGRPAGDGEDFTGVDVSLVGLFASGGESAVSLTIDEASHQIVGGASWARFSADLAEGPVGWAYFLAGDVNEETLLLSGAVAIDVPAQAGGAFMGRALRAATERELALAAAARERSQQLALAPRPRPAQPHHPAFPRGAR